MIRFWSSMDIRLRLALIALVVAFLPVAWYLGSPLFINRTVNESFPISAPAAMDTNMAQSDASMPVATADAGMAMAESQPASMAATSVPAAMDANMAQSDASMPAATADAGMAMAESMAATSVPTAMSENMAEGDAMAQDQPAATAGASMPAVDTPVMLSSGQVGSIDVIHKGQGQATIYKLPDGKRVLRFEQFQVTNGPDLYVYLSGHPAPREDAQVRQDGFEVAVLKGNIGDQNYELPDDLNLSKIKSLVIYCRRFSEVFSTAELMIES
jgi:hypothetical protein